MRWHTLAAGNNAKRFGRHQVAARDADALSITPCCRVVTQLCVKELNSKDFRTTPRKIASRRLETHARENGPIWCGTSAGRPSCPIETITEPRSCGDIDRIADFNPFAKTDAVENQNAYRHADCLRRPKKDTASSVIRIQKSCTPLKSLQALNFGNDAPQICSGRPVQSPRVNVLNFSSSMI